MGNPNGFRVVLLLAPSIILLFCLAAINFVLDRVTRSNFDEQTGGDTITLRGPKNATSNAATTIDVTLWINEGPTIAILGTDVLAWLVSAIGAFGIWELRRIEGTLRHQRVWCWVVLLSNLFMIGFAAGILGYTSAVQASEKGWQSYDDVGKYQGQLTRETWVCQIHRFFPTEGWAGTACSTSKASRFLMIALIIAPALVLISLSILVRERGGVKWLFGGKGRYGGFASVYELRPTHPGAGHGVQPVPQYPQYATYQAQPHSREMGQQPPTHGPAQRTVQPVESPSSRANATGA